VKSVRTSWKRPTQKIKQKRSVGASSERKNKKLIVIVYQRHHQPSHHRQSAADPRAHNLTQDTRNQPTNFPLRTHSVAARSSTTRFHPILPRRNHERNYSAYCDGVKNLRDVSRNTADNQQVHLSRVRRSRVSRATRKEDQRVGKRFQVPTTAYQEGVLFSRLAFRQSTTQNNSDPE